MSLSDTEKLPLSFVAEMAYCQRSAYYLLIDAPRSRDENPYIVDGRNVHAVADDGYEWNKLNKKIVANVWIHSEIHHLSGKIDALEFPTGEKSVVPVEFKRGGQRVNHTHEIQLALIALCLREMYPDQLVSQGAIYFTEDRRRHQVSFTDDLLEEATDIAANLRSMTTGELHPKDFPAALDTRCEGCCFYDLCHEV